jgi:hypothetical protein
LHQEKALELARSAGYQKLALEFDKRLKVYRQMSGAMK